jgi:hypothetical protein
MTMGDRGNIVMQYCGDQRIYFYTHSLGSLIAQQLRKALALKQCWDDEEYLASIVYDTLTEGLHRAGSGFSIGPTLGDNNHNLLVVNVTTQTVTEETERGAPVKTWTFQEFVDAR